MTLPPEPVQVELVSSAWGHIIPFAALVISLLSVGLTLMFRFMDRLQLRVFVTWVPVEADTRQKFTGLDRLQVKVTNRSRTAATEITGLMIRTSDKQYEYLEKIVAPGWDQEDSLPVTIGPGQSARLSYSAKRIGHVLDTESPQAKWIQGVAFTGHKKVRGKKLREFVPKLKAYAKEHTMARADN